MLFNSSFFIGLTNEAFTEHDFHPGNVGRGLDAMSAMFNEDGWGWWPFDLSSDHSGDYHWVRDETLETEYPGMNNFYMVGIPHYNDYDSAGAEITTITSTNRQPFQDNRHEKPLSNTPFTCRLYISQCIRRYNE